MQEDHVHDVEEEGDQVIAPRVEAVELVGETLDQPAERLVDAAGERREGEPDLFPAQTSERVVLENPPGGRPNRRTRCRGRVRRRSRRTRRARPRPARAVPGLGILPGSRGALAGRFFLPMALLRCSVGRAEAAADRHARPGRAESIRIGPSRQSHPVVFKCAARASASAGFGRGQLKALWGSVPSRTR